VGVGEINKGEYNAFFHHRNLIGWELREIGDETYFEVEGKRFNTVS